MVLFKGAFLREGDVLSTLDEMSTEGDGGDGRRVMEIENFQPRELSLLAERLNLSAPDMKGLRGFLMPGVRCV